MLIPGEYSIELILHEACLENVLLIFIFNIALMEMSYYHRSNFA